VSDYRNDRDGHPGLAGAYGTTVGALLDGDG
jgi:hypothetical protein